MITCAGDVSTRAIPSLVPEPFGRVTIVVGAASEIGLHLVEHFLARGDCVAAADIDPSVFKALTTRFGSRLLPVKVNPNRDAYIHAMFDQVQQRWRRIDTLINISVHSSKSQSGLGLGFDVVSNLMRMISAFAAEAGEQAAVVDVAWFGSELSPAQQSAGYAVAQAALKSVISVIAEQYLTQSLRINSVHVNSAPDRSSNDQDCFVVDTVLRAVTFLSLTELSGSLTGNVLKIEV